MEGKETDPRFRGMLQSDGLNGEVDVVAARDALLLDDGLDCFVCLYADIRAFEAEGHTLAVETAHGRLLLSQMGGALEWCRDKLWEAYNAMVQRALFVDGDPLYASRGEYRYEDAGGKAEGLADVRLFPNCVLILPPDEGARRVPLCFVAAIEEENHSLRLVLDTGEAYTFVRLGGYVEGFAVQLKACLRALREKAKQTAQDVGGGMDSMQLSAVAKLLPEGVAASMGELGAICPAFAQGVEGRIAQSRAAEPYAFFKEVCDPADVCVGFRRWEEKGRDETQGEAPAYAIFIAAPKAGAVAVELAIPEEDSAATFFYRCGGDWQAFRRRLNRAMEAVGFRREVVWMGEDALQKPEHAHVRMAVQRTEALRFLRGCFLGRVVHSSPEAWRREACRLFGE